MRSWRLRPEEIEFYTCARPGRSKGKHGKVSEQLLHAWVSGLPPGNLVIVSLLGTKRGPTADQPGKDEWSFYTFYAEGRTFEEWLVAQYPSRALKVESLPTVDSLPVPNAVVAQVRQAIVRLAAAQRTVLLMDSGGVQRVGQVCKQIGALRMPGH